MTANFNSFGAEPRNAPFAAKRVPPTLEGIPNSDSERVEQELGRQRAANSNFDQQNAEENRTAAAPNAQTQQFDMKKWAGVGMTAAALAAGVGAAYYAGDTIAQYSQNFDIGVAGRVAHGAMHVAPHLAPMVNAIWKKGKGPGPAQEQGPGPAQGQMGKDAQVQYENGNSRRRSLNHLSRNKTTMRSGYLSPIKDQSPIKEIYSGGAPIFVNVQTNHEGYERRKDLWSSRQDADYWGESMPPNNLLVNKGNSDSDNEYDSDDLETNNRTQYFLTAGLMLIFKETLEKEDDIRDTDFFQLGTKLLDDYLEKTTGCIRFDKIINDAEDAADGIIYEVTIKTNRVLKHIFTEIPMTYFLSKYENLLESFAQCQRHHMHNIISNEAPRDDDDESDTESVYTLHDGTEIEGIEKKGFRVIQTKDERLFVLRNVVKVKKKNVYL